MSRYDNPFGVIGLILSLFELLTRGHRRAVEQADRDSHDALAALKMPTPKLVMPSAKSKPPEAPPKA
ncbi:hypothetical protein sos41_26610 [Alphaproteobacteria bacterium SO-S41]|nr:hypothetical protein sos41_26610 [Alphaproteobacteria bacterium SO-S41]